MLKRKAHVSPLSNKILLDKFCLSKVHYGGIGKKFTFDDHDGDDDDDDDDNENEEDDDDNSNDDADNGCKVGRCTSLV